MKTLFRTCLFAALVGCAVAPAAAQSYNESHFYPDGLGGGQLVGPNGTTHFYSDGLGGETIVGSSWTLPEILR